jgi:sarcosine oxidase subunit beta
MLRPNRQVSMATTPRGDGLDGPSQARMPGLTPHRPMPASRPTPAKLAFNARIAAAIFPALREARIVRCWAGIEGHTPDGRPVISPSASEDGAFHAFGFCSHGFHLGPAIGRILAELVPPGRSNLPIEPFRVDRFAQRA